MSRITVHPKKLAELQTETERVRNICILAHVDHGKTTLSDSLVSSNGIISQRLAGSMRYLDSREDEQLRGITMQSSAISLLYAHNKIQLKPTPEGMAEPPKPPPKEYLINLIDSPGHVDFSADVSTAVRLCDGALIIIDVIEGVCIQTHAVLRQAWEENVRPCLVLNKIDRLITELQLTPQEAYLHLVRIIEHANSVTSSLINSSLMTAEAQEGSDSENMFFEADESMEEELLFSPERGNVVFASAMDSWSFRLVDFVPLWSTKLGIAPSVLMNVLWGEHYWGVGGKIITAKKNKSDTTRPNMFAQFVLQNIWEIYDACVLNTKPKKLRKIVETLGLSSMVSEKDMNRKEKKLVVRSVMGAWLPASRAVLSMVVRCIPSPIEAQANRVSALWPNQVHTTIKRDIADELVEDGVLLEPTISRPLSSTAKDAKDTTQSILSGFDDLTMESSKYDDPAFVNQELQKVHDCIAKCDSSPDAPVVVFVSKMVVVKRKHLSASALHVIDNARRSKAEASEMEEEPPEECFVAFARVFSGVLKTGQPLVVLGPKYNPLDQSTRSSHLQIVTTGVQPMMIMCDDFIPLDNVPAGNITAIAGVDQHILKTATLCSTPVCHSLTPMPTQSAPILRVSLEPVDPRNWAILSQGLRLLNRADAVVDVKILPSGEYVLGAIGELHLERCLKDLKERFAQIEVRVSEPIAVFRETIVLVEGGPKVPVRLESKDTVWPPPAWVAREQSKVVEQDDTNKTEDNVVSSDTQAVGAFGRVKVSTPSKSTDIFVRCIPLPLQIIRAIEANAAGLKLVVAQQKGNQKVEHEFEAKREEKMMDQSVDAIRNAFHEAGELWANEFENVWSLGPFGVGPCVLLNHLDETTCNADVLQLVRDVMFSQHGSNTTNTKGEQQHPSLKQVVSGVAAGFQLATRAGPLCEEAMWGVAFCVDQIVVHNAVQVGDDDRFGPLSGQVMSVMKEGCRRAFVVHHQQDKHMVETGCGVRLAEGYFRCALQCHVDFQDGDQLGKLYSVISKRRGKIVSEDMLEGTSIFNIEALVPVVEAFGLADDLRVKTSGAASTPQLVFSHWEVLDVDPFFRATTEDELEEFGQTGYEESYSTHNVARKYILAVRKRKGLWVNEKIVEYVLRGLLLRAACDVDSTVCGIILGECSRMWKTLAK